VLHYRATAAASSSHTCRLLRSLEAPALLSFFLFCLKPCSPFCSRERECVCTGLLWGVLQRSIGLSLGHRSL
jgi:hypothetical protein